MEGGKKIVDTFNGEKFKWIWNSSTIDAAYSPMDPSAAVKRSEKMFELTFYRRHKDMGIDSYLPHITNKATQMKHEKKTIKIFTVDQDCLFNNSNVWKGVTLDHPAPFDTLAMDDDQKKMILSNLERFVQRRELYRKVGRAWKRGFLLYGPPGTGKSSLVAAMANHFNFDIYDLELTGLKKNSDLRTLLLSTSNMSILVVEDIDCSIDLQERCASRHKFFEEGQVTISGLLNFVDGLWSSCGNQRIIIFTTNDKEKLDPAYYAQDEWMCTLTCHTTHLVGFRLLASNYLGITENVLFEEVEDLI